MSNDYKALARTRFGRRKVNEAHLMMCIKKRFERSNVISNLEVLEKRVHKALVNYLVDLVHPAAKELAESPFYRRSPAVMNFQAENENHTTIRQAVHGSLGMTSKLLRDIYTSGEFKSSIGNRKMDLQRVNHFVMTMRRIKVAPESYKVSSYNQAIIACLTNCNISTLPLGYSLRLRGSDPLELVTAEMFPMNGKAEGSVLEGDIYNRLPIITAHELNVELTPKEMELRVAYINFFDALVASMELANSIIALLSSARYETIGKILRDESGDLGEMQEYFAQYVREKVVEEGESPKKEPVKRLPTLPLSERMKRTESVNKTLAILGIGE